MSPRTRSSSRRCSRSGHSERRPRRPGTAVPVSAEATAGQAATASTTRRAARPHPAKAVCQRNHRLHLQGGRTSAEVGRPRTAQPEERRDVPWGPCTKTPSPEPSDSRATRAEPRERLTKKPAQGKSRWLGWADFTLACVRGPSRSGWRARLRLRRTSRSARGCPPARYARRTQQPRTLRATPGARATIAPARVRLSRRATAGLVRRPAFASEYATSPP